MSGYPTPPDRCWVVSAPLPMGAVCQERKLIARRCGTIYDGHRCYCAWEYWPERPNCTAWEQRSWCIGCYPESQYDHPIGRKPVKRWQPPKSDTQALWRNLFGALAIVSASGLTDDEREAKLRILDDESREER